MGRDRGAKGSSRANSTADVSKMYCWSDSEAILVRAASPNFAATAREMHSHHAATKSRTGVYPGTVGTERREKKKDENP